MSIVSFRNYLFPRSLKTNGTFLQISKTPGRLAVINVAYFRINYTMGVERRDKGSALFHSMLFDECKLNVNFQVKTYLLI